MLVFSRSELRRRPRCKRAIIGHEPGVVLPGKDDVEFHEFGKRLFHGETIDRILGLPVDDCGKRNLGNSCRRGRIADRDLQIPESGTRNAKRSHIKTGHAARFVRFGQDVTQHGVHIVPFDRGGQGVEHASDRFGIRVDEEIERQPGCQDNQGHGDGDTERFDFPIIQEETISDGPDQKGQAEPNPNVFEKNGHCEDLLKFESTEQQPE